MKTGDGVNENLAESFFLSEYFMTGTFTCAALMGFLSFALLNDEGFSYTRFSLLVKVITTVFMYYAFRHYEWDITKGLMGGVLFCLCLRRLIWSSEGCGRRPILTNTLWQDRREAYILHLPGCLF